MNYYESVEAYCDYCKDDRCVVFYKENQWVTYECCVCRQDIINNVSKSDQHKLAFIFHLHTLGTKEQDTLLSLANYIEALVDKK